MTPGRVIHISKRTLIEILRDDASPWGLGTGAEWLGEHPKFNPMLHQAGLRWIRLFPEWQTIQPGQGR